MVDNPLDWLILSVGLIERIYSYFEDYFVPLYECLFTRLGIRLPFSNFEVAMMNCLKVTPSQLHHRAWVFMKVFQLCVEHKYWEPSLELFFISFMQLAPLGIRH